MTLFITELTALPCYCSYYDSEYYVLVKNGNPREANLYQAQEVKETQQRETIQNC